MSYKTQTIIETIKGINQTYYLPSIQRKFVWDVQQIEKLFDSLMQGYPIGTFLFWAIEKGGDPSHIDEYVFYEFINNYNEKDAVEFMQTKVEKPSCKDKLVAVLDGQQRLSSLFCALRGSYAFKTSKRLSPNDPYPKRELYLNLLYHCENEMDDRYEFRFITPKEAGERDAGHYWLKVKDVIAWSDVRDGEDEVIKHAKAIVQEIQDSNYAELTSEQGVNIEICIARLWRKLVYEGLVTYFEIQKESLDDILDIFVRVNSAGTPLSKSDLVFSTIVANWEDGREKIENLLDNLNSRGFKFDKDFVIQLCLALMDLPQKFQVKTFTSVNVKKVSESWEGITAAISDSVDLLVEFGFSAENLTADYIIIPVTYYLYKSQKGIGDLKQEDKETIRKFLITGMVKRIFSASVESGLSSILSKLRRQREEGIFELCCSDHFDFDSLKCLEFQEKTLRIEESDVDEILDFKKGPLTFMVLSLLYPWLKLGNIDWHQDHIHPISAFEKKRLHQYLRDRGLQLDDSTLKEWHEKANKLVNLQLLRGKVNEEKHATPLVKWIDKEYPDEDKRNRYCEENYIDTVVGLELENFDAYYNKRREKLKQRLMSKSIFDVKVVSEEENRIIEEQRSEEEIAITPESRTIAEAVVNVLTDHPEGLTITQIYEEIIGQGLYTFNTETPKAVLRVEIRRRCENVEISKSYETKWFRIVKDENGEIYYGITFSD